VHLIDGRGFTFIGELPAIASKTSIGVARPWMVPHSDVCSPRKLMPALGRVREVVVENKSRSIAFVGIAPRGQRATSGVP